MDELTRVDVSRSSLRHNIRQIRSILAPETLLCACVKANAYGHGLVETARVFNDAGSDWLSVNALYEARLLRRAGLSCPICILGYVLPSDIAEAVSLGCRITVYNHEALAYIAEAARRSDTAARVHIKLETGTNRQGIRHEDLMPFAQHVTSFSNIRLEGLSTHFANIEDTSDPQFALLQLKRFKTAADALNKAGIPVPILHCANSAATILMSETHFSMVRPGIATYGMWPSEVTRYSSAEIHGGSFSLTPAFSWKTTIAQIKSVPAGEYVGYGLTCRVKRPTRLAVLPVGYYDGYDRGVTGGHVLIRKKKAPVLGRICMNIIMVDVTHISDARTGDEALLLGRSSNGCIPPEIFASWAGTINYEVTTRVNERIPRFIID